MDHLEREFVITSIETLVTLKESLEKRIGLLEELEAQCSAKLDSLEMEVKQLRSSIYRLGCKH